jgi:ribosome biogenesis GTPase
MEKFGLIERFKSESALYPELYVGRIASQYKDIYKVLCENGELMAEISGKFRYDAKALSDYPAVGDFVMLDRDNDASGNAVICNVLSRKSAFIRKAAGTSHNSQVVASNIDTVFICMSLNRDFNIRRIERYLAIAWDSDAMPVIVLTKSDLCSDVENKLNEVNPVAIGVDILVTSALTQNGYLQVLRYVKGGQTIAFIGSSGVGKSTLINRLMGNGVIKTDGLRNDDKGRHTTARRELIVLEQGGMVIDTPGMRELGIESADFSKSFADIDELAESCRFHDCTHTNEPGCAVVRAIHDGALLPDRYSSYLKLKKEAGYDGLNSRQIETAKLNEMFKDVGGIKGARKFVKEVTAKKLRY